MTNTEYSKKLDLIQKEALTQLSQFGYRRKGRTFNRSLESGLIHVINFQMGRRSLAGRFSLNLGIYVPEIYRLLWVWSEDDPQFVDHGDCEIAKRIGELVPPYNDYWWDLSRNAKRLSKKVWNVIEKYGLPYLKRFNSHGDVIQEWNINGDKIGLPPRAGLSIAILLHNMGDHEQARNLLIQEYSRKPDHPYAVFVVDIAQKLNISLDDDSGM